MSDEQKTAVFPPSDPDGSKARAELQEKFQIGVPVINTAAIRSVPSFVGLDMSLTSSGFCCKRGDVLTVETIKTTPKTCDNDLARIRYIVDAVLSRIPKMDVKMVCIEDFFTPQNPFQIGAAIGLAMLGAVMRLALYEKGYPFFVIAPGQLKKFATGKGVGQKSIIVREVYKRWGVDAKEDRKSVV